MFDRALNTSLEWNTLKLVANFYCQKLGDTDKTFQASLADFGR